MPTIGCGRWWRSWRGRSVRERLSAKQVRRLLDNELAADRTERIARARTIPTRLMIPVTLLMLPGLVLLLYAPSLLGLFEDLTGVLR
jgi:hypothetical protein